MLLCVQAVHVQLSKVQSSEVPRFRAAAALLTTQLADLGQQMSDLAAQEVEGERPCLLAAAGMLCLL